MLANHDIPTNVVYEDDEMFCFHDAEPQAPVHRMMLKIKDIAKELGLENGYRVVSNNGADAFQTVKHLHFHILGKRKMTWPPG